MRINFIGRSPTLSLKDRHSLADSRGTLIEIKSFHSAESTDILSDTNEDSLLELHSDHNKCSTRKPENQKMNTED